MPRVRNTGQFAFPTYNQAAKIITRFGGEAKLAALIGISRVSVYRWQYKRPYGSDGLIPTAHIEKIKAVARHEGILLRDEDWVPSVNQWDTETLQLVKRAPKRKTLAELLA
jgi:DNA-binding transcriptional regulator YdaS (Cro superfamily)